VSHNPFKFTGNPPVYVWEDFGEYINFPTMTKYDIETSLGTKIESAPKGMEELKAEVARLKQTLAEHEQGMILLAEKIQELRESFSGQKPRRVPRYWEET
jgi:hypothetical protein